MKAALIHYAQRLALELATENDPGELRVAQNTYFDGGFWQNVEKNSQILCEGAGVKSDGPNGRAGGIERGIVFLASPASSFTTGTEW